ncbi:Fic family protein [Helicobacter sp. T3_23-1059]
MGSKWIWQSEKYPHFYFDEAHRECVNVLLFDISKHNKTLNQIISQNNLTPILLESEINALTDEIVNSASIEGEILKRDSVRSSLRKKLDKEFDFMTDKHSTRQSDNYASILLDTNLNKNSLSIERMHGWHNCLFESGYSGLHKINIAKFRVDKMQVVSGAIGREKIHYEAIPAKNIHKDMEAFLHYCNDNSINPYIRSAIAHLWFVIIHPYDDGNGRIARAIADYLLPNKNIKLYSISAEINRHKKAYYEVLEKTNRFNANCNITEWLEWHLSMTKLAMQNGIEKIEKLIYKTTFWDNFRHLKLNNNQQKVLNKILDIGIKDFRGQLSAKRYSRIAKIDLQTAQKEIDELCSLSCLVKKTDSFSKSYFTLPKNLKILQKSNTNENQATHNAESKSKIRNKR